MRHRWGRRSPGTLGIIAVLCLGLVATMFAVRDERVLVSQDDTRAAELAASQLSGALRQSKGSLRGVDSLAVDATVESSEFTAYASDVLDDSLYTALAYAEVVDADRRAEFEVSTGLAITDTDGAGGFVPATPRARSIVVVEVHPLNETTERVLGFDIAGDPIRADAAAEAEASGAPAISDRTITATGARAGISLMQAVRTPDGETIGFVTSGVAVDSLLARSQVDPGDFAGFALTMDDVVLVGGGQSGATSSFEVAGRRFDVTVDTGSRIGLVLPAGTIVGTILLAAAVYAAARSESRQRTRLATIARRNRGIAELGRVLAASPTSDAVITDVLRHGGPVVDNARTTVVRRSRDDAASLLIEHGDGEVARPVDRSTAPASLLECIDTAATVAIADTSTAADPDISADGNRGGALVAVPLMFSDDFCFGTLGFVWDEAITADELEERSVAATTIAELVSRALERAVITEVVQSGVGNLSTFARALASAHTAPDVRAAVRTHAAAILGAHSAELHPGPRVPAVSPDTSEPGRAVERVIKGRNGGSDALLRVQWRDPLALSTTRHAVLATLGDLIDQTLARTALADQQHHLIAQLQRDLLPAPPEVPGLEVAVRYRPAMSIVGLGGDFYDVIVSASGRIYLVIGDVTGHGSEAVAAMAELTSVTNHLLRSDAPIESVCAEADVLLARRRVLATAQIFEIDLENSRMRYVNAGHPYPIRRGADGAVDLLVGGRRMLLGLDLATPVPVTIEVDDFVVGDTLLLYTDGLIERRSQHIDDAIAALQASVRKAPGRTPHDLLVRLLTDEMDSRDGDRVDDDIALIAVRHCAVGSG